MSWKRWLLIGIVGAVVLLVGGPFVYIRFIEGEPPAPLSLKGSPVPSGAPSSLDGTWKVSSGSVAGYRVNEVLFGQNNIAVGRTNDVTGTIVVNGTVVTRGSFTADMTTVRSDQERRDRQFQGRIMDTSTYPTAKFEFADPVDLAPLPAAGQTKTVSVKGRLTLRGTTRDVIVSVTARRAGAGARVAGSIPVIFADYNIPPPSFGPATTENGGALEFSLTLEHA